MTSRATFAKWAVLGGVVASVFLVGQASSVGGVAGLLQVGESSALRPAIEAQLGEIPLAPGPGHDGQISYAIALDLEGEEIPDLLDHGAYRYRRILYPLVSSAGGLLDGYPLLYGMVIVTIVSMAVAAGGVAAISVNEGRSEWLALTVLLNPGLWLSVRLLTVDAPALALMILALHAVSTRRRTSAVAWFALSALSKDVFLATPAGLSVSDWRRRWSMILVPVGVLTLWMVWLTNSMGEGFTGRGNASPPFFGIVEAAPNWASFDVEEWIYLIFALGSVALGLFVGFKHRGWLRWSIIAWSALGVISSNWVWDFGNNAARAFAPIAVLVALSYASVEADDVSRAAAVGDLASGR